MAGSSPAFSKSELGELSGVNKIKLTPYLFVYLTQNAFQTRPAVVAESFSLLLKAFVLKSSDLQDVSLCFRM